MRIALFVSAYPTPSETFVLDQVAGLRDAGHDVCVFARSPEHRTPSPKFSERNGYGEEIYRVPRGAGAVLEACAHTLAGLYDPQRSHRQLARNLLSMRGARFPQRLLVLQFAAATVRAGSRFDAIVAHFGPNGLLAQQLRDVGALHGPLATIFHGRDISLVLRQRGSNYYQALFEKGELMLPVSEYFRRRLLDLGCPEAKLRVQHMGVDTSLLRYEPRTLIAGHTLRLVSVCRLVEKKGLDFAMHALARLRRTYPNFEWHVAGDGPERQRLIELRDKLELGAQVTFHGAQPREQVRLMLKDAHLFVGTSVTSRDGDEEGVPVALMEAAACGLPIISTFHSGIPELVRNGETGVLVTEHDVAGLAERLAELIDASARWPEMGWRGSEIVRADYNLERLNNQLCRALEELAVTGASAHPDSAFAH